MVLSSINTYQDLREHRADPEDEDYKSPSAGGCWICHRGMRDEEWFDDFSFSMEFDTYVHPGCLWLTGVNSVYEFEQGDWRIIKGRPVDHHRTGTTHLARGKSPSSGIITYCGITLPHEPRTVSEKEDPDCRNCLRVINE